MRRGCLAACHTPAVHRAEPLPRPVGRDAEVEYAASLLGADPAGHLRVSAGPGMGSSSFARFVATTTGRPVRWVRADPVSRCIPLGVLAALVSSPAEPLGAGPDMLVRAVARLVPDPACPPVVVVDGAEHLDDSSALVLAQAADAGATLVLTTARATPLPAALAAFVRAAAVGEVLLGPLDDGAVASLAADVLGAPVDPALIRAVTRLVGGAPAAIVDVLERAARSDRGPHRVGMAAGRCGGAATGRASARGRPGRAAAGR